MLVFRGVSKFHRKSFIFDHQTDGFSIAPDDFQALSLELGSSCYVLYNAKDASCSDVCC